MAKEIPQQAAYTIESAIKHRGHAGQTAQEQQVAAEQQLAHALEAIATLATIVGPATAITVVIQSIDAQEEQFVQRETIVVPEQGKPKEQPQLVLAEVTNMLTYLTYMETQDTSITYGKIPPEDYYRWEFTGRFDSSERRSSQVPEPVAKNWETFATILETQYKNISPTVATRALTMEQLLRNDSRPPRRWYFEDMTKADEATYLLALILEQRSVPLMGETHISLDYPAEVNQIDTALHTYLHIPLGEKMRLGVRDVTKAFLDGILSLDPQAPVVTLTSVDILNLPSRSETALRRNDITSIEELSQMTTEQVSNLHQAGVKTLKDIHDSLIAHGYTTNITL